MKTIFILNHTNGGSGGFNTIIEYLNENDVKYYVLQHPLDDYSKLSSTLQRPDGSLQTIKRRSRGLINLAEDFYYSTKIIYCTNFDTFLGVSNFDTIPAIFCRKILRKKIERIIFYPRDYSQYRYKNKILDWIYRSVESVAVRGADITISNTLRSETQRITHGLKPQHSLVLANPVNLNSPKFEKKLIRKDYFIYVGDVTVEHGLYDLVEAISPLIKKLVIIGDGPDWDRTLALVIAKKLNIEVHKNKTHDFVVKYLESFLGFGLAPYNLSSKWTHYCSPLKVGEYIASGVPVLMSDVPEIADQLKKEGLGVVYQNARPGEISKMLDELDVDDYYIKAEKFYAENNYRTVLSKIGL